MLEEEYIIKKSKSSLLYRIFITVLCIPLIIYYCYENVSRDDDWLILFSYFGVVICIGVSLNFIHEYRERYYEIVLSKTGIDLRYQGLFTWDMIESFSVIRKTAESSSGGTFLIMHFKEYADLSIEVSNLDVSKKKLIELVLTYGKSSGVYYREN